MSFPCIYPPRILQWNRTASSYARDASIDQLFAQQAARTPHALAVEFEHARLSYAQLEARANQLAHRLLERGVRPGDIVGMLLPRSPAVFVGMLGVLKAGGAYLPLNVHDPAARRMRVIADAGVRVLLTQKTDPAANATGTEWLDLEDISWTDSAAEFTGRVTTSMQRAYVLYTSGSTGMPKGVEVPHRAVVRLVKGADYLQVGPGDRVAQVSAVSFDAATFEIWSALLNGGTVVGIDDETRLDPSRLVARLRARDIHVLFLTTALFHQIAYEVPRAFAGLRALLFGGEVAKPARVRAVLDSGKPTRLLHMYGPTENTSFTTWYEVESLAPGAATVPIGRPIANTHIHILNDALKPVPVGVTGELYVGGDGLALGYLNRPERTAEAFIPNPFGPGRLYRTGDLAYWSESGQVEFVGRVDRQVKVRGFRIELPEIERALGSHPDVREAFVTVTDVVGSKTESQQRHKRIDGYIVPHHREDTALIDEVRTHLQRMLPAYMIPGAWAVVSKLPLTSHGKVDRRALPAARAHTASPYAEPRTQTEATLCALWERVLAVPRVGLHDNIFELGGHSLTIARICARVRVALQIELSLADFFTHSTVAELGAAIDARAPSTNPSTASTSPSSPLTPGPVGRNEFPLSPAQRRLWFLCTIENGNAAYNVPSAIRLRGPLDVDALRASMRALVRRHAALRTSISSDGGVEPRQRISRDVAIPWQHRDISDTPSSRRGENCRAIIKRALRCPFDIGVAPLLRVVLITLAPDDHIFVLIQHHLVTDGWSVSLLWRELGHCYRRHDDPGVPELPPLPVQYGDYARWLSDELESERLQTSLDYWRTELSGLDGILALPADRPRPAQLSYVGDDVRILLPPPVTEGVRALGRACGCSPFMVMETVFALFLRRISGQRDIAIGIPVANREHEELEGILGLFVNILVLRVQIADDDNVFGLLKRVKDKTLAAHRHRQVPFDQLVRALAPHRSLSHHPFIQVLFAWQNAPWELPAMNGMEVSRWPVPAAFSRFDLSVSVEGVDTPTWELVWEYATDVFDRATIERWIGHFQTLLTALLDSSRAGLQRPATALPLLDAEERQRLLCEWNDTRAEIPRDGRVHVLFAEQAARTPDAIAVEYAEEVVTYRALNERAERLASHLRGRGVAPESLIGVCVERSIELVVGLLAVWKAGCAYVPLDPTHPVERNRYILADSGASVLLTQRAMMARLPAVEITVCLDDEPTSHAVASTRSDTSLAYMIYTSGSTGRPKGVAIEHQALVNFLSSMRKSPGLSHTDALLAVTTVCFDIAVLELYLPLLVGARLVLASTAESRDGRALIARIAASSITVMQATPATWKMVLDSGEFRAPGLRALCGGEALSWQLAARLTDHVAEAWNLYGPTETTVWSAYYRIEPAMSPAHTANAVVPIGMPLDNTQLHVLDSHLEPAPIGVTGELYIGGHGLARGYHGRPALTEERFVANPFAAGRLYRTGDLARRRADGAIDFVGRLDDQLKIRGFRIEPGEIEMALGALSEVADCAVVARGDDGERRLVAYIVLADERSKPSSGYLRQRLGDSLPAYMLPAQFTVVHALPRTPNGKLDRRALPEPVDSVRETTRTPPTTAMERIVADIWRRELFVESIDVDDDFFALGGHSLALARVVAQLEHVLQRPCRIEMAFRNPTVRGLAAQLARQSASDGMLHATSEERDILADCVLPSDIRPEHAFGASASVSRPRTILLTGASGFLGVYLLAGLIQRVPDARIACLVRGHDVSRARARLQEAMRGYGQWQASYADRIDIWTGDLSRPDLGWSRHVFDQRAAAIDVIYHSAAWVNALYPYSALRPVNVFGTEQVLRLACRGHGVVFHHLSTLSVFEGELKHQARVGERTVLPTTPLTMRFSDIKTGYGKSKWVAEHLVHEARERGLRACIYRPTVVMGDVATGRCNAQDLLALCLRSFVQSGLWPQEQTYYYMASVDRMVEVLLDLAARPSSIGETFNLTPKWGTTSDVLLDWIRSAGHRMHVLPYASLKSRALSERSPMLMSLCPYLDRVFDIPGMNWQHDVEQANVSNGLNASHEVFPEVGRDFFLRCLEDILGAPQS